MDSAPPLPAPEKEVARVLAMERSVRRVILFGSRARGDHFRSSDLDVAVDAPDADIHAWDRMMRLLDTRASLVPVDLVLLHDAPPALRAAIDREGRVLFERGV